MFEYKKMIKEDLLNDQTIDLDKLLYILRINILKPLTEYDKLSFTAMTSINKDNRSIMINTNKIKDEKLYNFIICYLTIEFLNTSKEEYISEFQIDNLDLETYTTAKLLYKRSINNKKLIKK